MEPTLVHGILLYTVLLISLVVHEAAHALTALWGGDRTAYLGGQVTLNPLPHIRREPFGTVLLPISVLIFSGGQMCMGFAHAPVDPSWAARHPKKAAFMSAAGPVSNFLLATLAAVTLKILISQGLVATYSSPNFWGIFRPADGSTSGSLYATCLFLSAFLIMNLLLGILNIIPFPPLDGSGVLGGLFPKVFGRFNQMIREQPVFLIIGFVAIFYGLQPAVIWAFNLVFELIQ